MSLHSAESAGPDVRVTGGESALSPDPEHPGHPPAPNLVLAGDACSGACPGRQVEQLRAGGVGERLETEVVKGAGEKGRTEGKEGGEEESEACLPQPLDADHVQIPDGSLVTRESPERCCLTVQANGQGRVTLETDTEESAVTAGPDHDGLSTAADQVTIRSGKEPDHTSICDNADSYDVEGLVELVNAGDAEDMQNGLEASVGVRTEITSVGVETEITSVGVETDLTSEAPLNAETEITSGGAAEIDETLTKDGVNDVEAIHQLSVDSASSGPKERCNSSDVPARDMDNEVEYGSSSLDPIMTPAGEDVNSGAQSSGSEFEDIMASSDEDLPRVEEATPALPEWAVKTVQSPRNDEGVLSDDEDFFDALDHQVEQEFEVALPHTKGKRHRRTGSDLSLDSCPNDMSSESESEGSVNEARVYTTKANSPKKGPLQGKKDHRRQGSQDKIRPPRGTPSTPTSTTPASGQLVSGRKRRTTIPEKPNISLNLWSVMKNCIGKELSKIPMPVNFSEPLSMLQRLTEELEYSEILDQAALCDDMCEQLAYVAAFTVSAYATTLFRTGKPFNPLLGETYEFDRTEDYGWKSLAEQVSHHPPTLATHAEGRGWTLWQEFTMTTKFRGRYLQIIPMGIAHLTFSKFGSHYTWRKVTTTVHNIIVGRLWVDNQGEMDITNHTTGDKCHLKYNAYSYFSKDPPRKVTGVVTDSKGNARWVLTGNWCTKMEGAPVIHIEESNKGKPVFETGPHKQLWKVRPPPPGAERIYFFSQLAIEMNEPEEGVAPTDSRLRPDQRMMEEGKWDEANNLKFLLEEKQRAARRQREAEAEKLKQQVVSIHPSTSVPSNLPEQFIDAKMDLRKESPISGGTRRKSSVENQNKCFAGGKAENDFEESSSMWNAIVGGTADEDSSGLEMKVYKPTWFRKEVDPVTNNLQHVFTGQYWDCKAKRQWDMCPDIFL